MSASTDTVKEEARTGAGTPPRPSGSAEASGKAGTEARHTPGPWEVCGMSDLFAFWSPSDKALVGVAHHGNRRAMDTREISQEEARANARLIAAAPELLRLLDALTKDNPQGITSTEIGELVREARAVIAKATNGT